MMLGTMREACVGVDGCRAGWLCVWRDGDAIASEVVETGRIGEVLDAARSIAIDMPIGLSDDRDRACDRAARHALGRRRSTVFPAPLRCTLDAESYDEAKQRQRAAHLDGKALSLQAYHLLPKIRALDTALRAVPVRAHRTFEVHPELAFSGFAGKPLPPKRSAQGRALRQKLLATRLGASAWQQVEERWKRRDVARDDVGDALVCLLVAEAIVTGDAVSICEPVVRDRYDLPMAIWYVPDHAPEPRLPVSRIDEPG